MRTDNEARRAAQIAYVQARENLVARGLAEEERQYLRKQRPVGIDFCGRIVLEQKNTTAPAAAKHSTALQRLKRELVKHGWANGLTLKPQAGAAVASQPRRKSPAVVFLPRFLACTTLPHSAVQGNEYSRRNGSLRLSMPAPRAVGLPYGVYPRLILMCLTAGAARNKSRSFYLGASRRDFLQRMEIAWSAGPRGGFTAARAQMDRMCATTFLHHDVRQDAGCNIVAIDQWVRSEGSLTVKLSESFFNLCRQTIVPLDTAIVRSLRRSTLSLDLYAWLTYRVSTLERDTLIPREALAAQFGSNYKHSWDFRAKFRKSLRAVLSEWPAARAEAHERGLALRPCAPSIVESIQRQAWRGRAGEAN